MRPASDGDQSKHPWREISVIKHLHGDVQSLENVRRAMGE